jgi:hypothetical protein
MQQLSLFDGFPAILRLSAHFEVPFARKEFAECLAYQRVVIYDEH